jgi:UDP-N-acetylglucosamine--N-acetylmuramyl-(pentapeptide) pyrophosphoryl-undecaprenol N-acetylglucosamine transferase
MKNQEKVKTKRIILTGGHAATTAVATIQELRKRRSDLSLHWVGTKRAFEGKTIPNLESFVLPRLGVKQHLLISGKLQRKFTIWTIPSLIKIPISFVHALLIILSIRPNLIVSFGGHTALPVVFIAKLFKTPVIIHEQTMAVGLVNKISSYFADKIALARYQSLKYFPKDKCEVVGNPVITQFLKVNAKHKIGNPPTLFITGGSRGSTAINSIIEEVIKVLLKDFLIIHHTGFIDFDKFTKIKNNISYEFRKKYTLHARIDPVRMHEVYKKSDIVISRAGANAVSEIMVTQRPAILIPLPIAYLEEQKKNAKFAEKFGIAKVIDQKDLTSEKLLKEILSIKKNWSRMIASVKNKKNPDIKASSKFVDLIEDLVA